MAVHFGQLNSNFKSLQMDQVNSTNAKDQEIASQREKQADAKHASLNDNQRAADLRAEAQTIKDSFNAAAATVAAVGAACAAIPYVGPVIAAICAMVAACLILIGNLIAKTKEDEAAQLEREAGMKDLEADKHKNAADDVKKQDEDHKAYVEQMRQQLLEEQKQQSANAKF